MKSSNIKLLKIIIVIYLLLISFSLYSKEIPFTQEDRDRIIRIETKLEQMEKRFENRFEDINNRFEDINKRFEDLITYMWMLTSIFTGLIVAILGFAIWERYNIFKKVKSEVVEEINEGKIEKIQKIENSLKEYAKADKKMAIILKNHGLI